MKVKTLVNAYVGEWNTIHIFEYAGDANTIGADLEEDYEEILTAHDLISCGNYQEKEVEYFTVTGNALYLYLE